MINTSGLTTVLASIAALQPDIALALGAYQIFKTIWLTVNPGKTEADYQAYLQTSSQTNIDSTAALLTAHGYVETPPGSGNWSKPVA